MRTQLQLYATVSANDFISGSSAIHFIDIMMGETQWLV